jgi:hypothetical protein
VPRRTYTEIVFHGDQLLTVILPEGVAVPTRLVAQAIGVEPEHQAHQLRNHPVLSEGLRIVRVPDGDQLRPMLAILHTYIPFWLATINPSQVGEPVREKRIRNQREQVAEVLQFAKLQLAGEAEELRRCAALRHAEGGVAAASRSACRSLPLYAPLCAQLHRLLCHDLVCSKP